MIPRFSTYLFDIDGTLLDSAPDICGAITQVILKEGASAPSFDFLRSYVGLHITDCFSAVFPSVGEVRVLEMVESYRVRYRAREHKNTRVFPGVIEGLAALRGRKATATTKGSPMTKTLMDLFALSAYFDHLQGTDGFPSKPEPDVIYAALRALGSSPAECLMVGDSVADIQAAKAARVKVAAVRYGYGDPVKLAALEPDFWLSDLRELAG